MCENEATPSVSCSLNLPFDNQVLMIVFIKNQHIVLLPVRTSPAGGGYLLRLAGGFWISRPGERQKFRFGSLQDPHLYPRRWVQIFSTGCPCHGYSLLRVQLEDLSAQAITFLFGARSEILWSRAYFFSYAHSDITHMYVLFPMLLFFAKCKALKASLGKAGDITQLEEGLPHMQEVLGLIPTP